MGNRIAINGRSNLIRVLIVEGASLMREGLVAVLSNEPGITIAGVVESGDEIVPVAVEIKPDVALIDVDLPCMDGFAVAQMLRSELPACAMMLTAARRKPGDLRRAAAAEAAGFMLKDTPLDDMARAIRQVASGQRVIDADLVFAALRRSDSPLTPRELEVLRLVAEGATTAQIADTLVVTIGTVRNHLSRINSKTGARNRVHAIRIAEQGGWL
jgi:two-component system response regulator DesR